MRRLACRLLALRTAGSRRRVHALFTTMVWLLAAAACACLLAPAVAFLSGAPREWYRQVGSRTYAWGLGYEAYVAHTDPLPNAGPRPGERGMLDQWVVADELSFGVGRRVYMRHDVFYSARPGDTYDPFTAGPQKLASFRRVTEHQRRLVVLDLLRCAALLGLLPAIVLLRWARRHVLRRRPLDRAHCPSCGYDLRATPERCPECGTLAPEPVTS